MATAGTTYNVSPNPDDSTFGILPIGSVVMWTTPTVPIGFLFCDGAAISRITFVHLFGVIGTTYGAGDGSTTFNLPNLSGKVVRGVGLAPYTLASIGGSDNITLVATDLPNHAHSLTDPAHDHVDLGHTHTAATQGLGYFAQTGGDGNRADAGNTGTGFAVIDKAFTGITVDDSLFEGGVQITQTPTSIINTYLTLNFIIKI